MSSIDPALAAAQALLQAVDTAIADATLNLGASGAEIVAQLQPGDLLPAVVLAPQGGTDLLEIFGQTVAAQLPPGIHPGETIVLQVNGFDGNRILVSNLGIADPNHPPQLAQVVVPQAPPSSEPRIVATLTAIPQPSDPAAPGARPAVPQPLTPQTQVPIPPTAPPREVFVAASVRQAPAQPAPAAGEVPPAIVAEAARGASDIEARIGATRTAPSGPPHTRAAPDRETAPPIVPSAVRPTARPQQSVPLSAILTPRVKIPVTLRLAQAEPVQRTQQAPADGAAERLLARIRVPQTAFALAAARVANEAAALLPRAFARLEALLPRELPPGAATLRTLLAFVSKLDLSNSRALPEQIAAFVSHVVDGSEPKVAQALVAYRDGEVPPPPTVSTQPHEADSSAAQTQASARAIERVAAADFDVKSALEVLAQSVQSGASPQLARAVSDALTAATGVQFAALANAATDPNAIAIALPAFFHDGGRPAQMRIDRDAPGGREPLDADNFRISFVLDTATLGTLAIDVETVGRTVRVDVKTERTRAAERINGTLPDLRARFEQLRYRVAAMTAGVIPPRNLAASASFEAPAAVVPAEEPSAAPQGLDIQA